MEKPKSPVLGEFKNLDGLVRSPNQVKSSISQRPIKTRRSLDGLSRIVPVVVITGPQAKTFLFQDLPRQNRRKKFIFFQHHKLPIFLTLGLMLASFGGGIWFMAQTSSSSAEEALPARPVVSQAVIHITEPVVLGPIETVPNEVLFNLSIEQLEGYLKEALKTPEMREAEILALRKEKLVAYLQERKSPFVNIVDTLAGLKHWKMVLAISNSESSLGKHCYTNNCSGIGVEPGHPLWREYDSTAEWAKDLDKLLEKRYKDWTLEKMNGVYNQPGSANWLLATKQILSELQERGIE